MNVSLPPALEKLVQDKVSSGMYDSESEVIRKALRMMADIDHHRLSKLEALESDGCLER